jgi:spermidine synthase
MYTDVIAKIPPGTIGVAKLIHDSPDPLTRMRAARDGQPLNREKYARLIIRGKLYMTDAEFERWTNVDFVQAAKGDVLIAGLGIGLILDPIIPKSTSVTVIEREPDVIKLVSPHFPSVKVVEADIEKWEPPKGTKYDTIYFDIWPDICEGDLMIAKRLHSKFRKYLRKGGWMRSWTTFANRAMRRYR